MKKSLLILLASVAIAAVSCNKLEIKDPSTSIYEIINDGGITKTAITIGLDADTKTVLDTISGPNNARTRKVIWKAGDQISVNGVVSDPLGAEYDGKGTARFLFDGTIGRPSESAPWKILYPASANVDKITLSASQTLAEGDNISTDTMPMAAKVTTLKYPVQLQNLCAILSVELATGATEYTVSSIEITATGGEKINGDFSVNYAVDNSTISVPTSGGGSVITFTCGSTGASLKPGRNIFANVVIPAGEYQGFSVLVSYTEGSTAKTKTESLGKPDKTLNINQGKIIAMPTPFYLDSQTNPTINGYFVTPTGARNKDGSNWENAMGTTEFINMLIRPYSDIAGKAAAIHGKNFFLSAGTYQIKGQSYDHSSEGGGTLKAEDGLKLEFSGYSKNVNINIFGGYKAGLTGKNLTRHDVKGNETRLIPTTGERIMEIGNNVDVLIDGCTLTGAKNALDGSAIQMWPSGSQSCLTLDNCKMTNNVRTTDAGYAACVDVAYGAFVARNCEFTHNAARAGTVVRARYATATVNMSNCLIADNTSTHCCSGVSTGLANVTIDGCTFRNNDATWGGGALHIDCEDPYKAKYPTMTVTNSVFESNSTAANEGGGAVTVQCGKFIGTNLIFKENHAKKGGALALLDKGLEIKDDAKTTLGYEQDYLPNASVDLTDCQFIGNYSTGNGGAITAVAGKMTLTRTKFTKNDSQYRGGVVDVYRGCFRANDCIFDGNTSKNNGSFIWMGEDSAAEHLGCVMLNNCYIANNRNNYWGGMIQGQRKAKIMAYNCTFKDNGGNGEGALNGSFCTLLANCAMISNEPAMREDEGSDNTTNVWANTLLFTTKNPDSLQDAFRVNKGTGVGSVGTTNVAMKGGCITGKLSAINGGSFISNVKTDTDFSGQIYGNLNITFNESTKKFTVGNKPAGYEEASSNGIATMMRQDFQYTTPGPSAGQYSGLNREQSGMGACDNLGLAFYNWLHTLGAL